MGVFDLLSDSKEKVISNIQERMYNDSEFRVESFNDYLLNFMQDGDAKRIFEEGCKLEKSNIDLAKKCYRISANLGYKRAEYKLQILD